MDTNFEFLGFLKKSYVSQETLREIIKGELMSRKEFDRIIGLQNSDINKSM